jgi:hypothetical protein
MEASSFELFPNPSGGDIFVQHEYEIQEIQVFDLAGKSIFAEQYSLPKKQLSLNLSNLPKGLYWLEIETAQGLQRKSFVRN